MNTVIIVCGTPGAGKSTYARWLSAENNTVLLDIDTATERLVKIALTESGRSADDRDSDYFKQTFREPIYETLFDIARENLPVQDVIIVGPFTREIRDREWPARLAAKLGSRVEVHYVQCRPEVRRQRLAQRGEARDLAKLHDWDTHVRYYEDEAPPVFEHLLVDGCSSQGK